jgi:hypothetical protein
LSTLRLAEEKASWMLFECLIVVWSLAVARLRIWGLRLQGRPEFVGTIEAEADEILAFVGWRANLRWVV